MPTLRTDIAVSSSPSQHELKLPEGRPGRLLAIGITVMFAVLMWILVSSLVAFYQDGKSDIENKHLILSRTEALVESIPALRAKYETATQTASGSTLLITETSDETALARLQESVHDAADSVQAVLTSQEPLPVVRSGSFERLGVRISLTTSWPDFVHLLDVLDGSTSPRLLVDDLQLQVAGSARLEEEAMKGRMVDAAVTILALRDAPLKRVARSTLPTSSSSSFR